MLSPDSVVGFYFILIIAQEHCVYQEEILRRTSVRRQFRRRVAADNSVEALRNLKVYRRI